MPGSRDPETLGELSRRQDRFEQAVASDIAELRQTCAAQAAGSVRQDVYAAQREADARTVADLRNDLEDAQNRVRWAWRTAVTAILGPLAAGVVAVLMRGLG